MKDEENSDPGIYRFDWNTDTGCSAGTGDISVAALAAGSNIALLEQQIREFHPRLVAVWDKKKAEELKIKTADLSVEILDGMDGLLAVAQIPEAEILVTAIVGMLGIRPTIAAIRAGKDIALANKETLVTAGHLIMPMAEENHVSILPVDSEHSAIFQSLNGERHNKIHKILLTASGGPFRGKTREELKDVTVEDALKHPNWSMGRKITVDSATLVNKGLEVMEAKWLFDVELSQIQVVVQPQSVIHSMVEYEDGAIIAELGTADMRLPIQYALYYPDRRPLSGERLDFYKLDRSHLNARIRILSVGWHLLTVRWSRRKCADGFQCGKRAGGCEVLKSRDPISGDTGNHWGVHGTL